VPKDSARQSDIDIRFTKGVLPNGLIFDGPDGLASYSFYPTNPDFPGDIYFDASEKWALKDDGINLLQVATQEIGHALGLAHSDDPNAVMWPFYVGFEENFQLGQDDINAIRALYGADRSQLTGQGLGVAGGGLDEAVTSKAAKPTTAMTTFAPPITERPFPMVPSRIPFIPGPSATGASPNPAAIEPCQVGFVPDAIVQTRDENMYLFKNNNYWLIRYSEAKGIEIPAGYPKQVSDWGGIQGPIDSAFTGLKGRTYIFKGKEYWKFDNMVKEGGYPRLIANGFPGIPDNIDAVFVWPGDNLTYFVKSE
jgi:Matrixin/Hemopexin